jgi:hypothetical protein
MFRFQVFRLSFIVIVHAACGSVLTRAEEPANVLAGSIVPVLNAENLKFVNVPSQQRDPKRFWQGKKVFQKTGVVIEDKDYIVRERYWELGEHAIGKVAEVRPGAQGVVCRVIFGDREHWQQKGFEKKPVGESVVQEFQRSGYEKTHVTTTYRIEGVAVEKQKVGLVIEDGPDGLVVDFPALLLSLSKPNLHDQVVRSADWFDGYADGAEVPYGSVGADPRRFAGVVVKERDIDGNVEVEWLSTGRISTHRFDARLFYDIELLERAGSK